METASWFLAGRSLPLGLASDRDPPLGGALFYSALSGSLYFLPPALPEALILPAGRFFIRPAAMPLGHFKLRIASKIFEGQRADIFEMAK
jgi:hypothetical protein